MYLNKDCKFIFCCRPENVPRLFDLIKVSDDRVRPAFYYALRDTLVANELNQASRIAYGKVRHRVVTLNGEIIEPSGNMNIITKSTSTEMIFKC